MANSISNIDLSFVGAELLGVSQEKAIPNGAMATQFFEGKIEGDVVKVDTLGAPVAAAAWNDTTNNYATPQAISESFIDVTLNQRKITTFTVSADDYQRIGNKGLTARLARSVKEIVRESNVTAMNLINAANYGAAVHTGVASTLDLDAIGVINTNADIQKWTVNDMRHMVLLPAYYWNIATEASIVNVNQRGSTEVNHSGVITNDVLGWGVTELNTIPANGENLTGFVTDGRGICVAYGVKADWEDKASYFSEVFVDPETGFAYRMTVSEIAGTHNKNFTFETLYGVAVGQADALKRIVSA